MRKLLFILFFLPVFSEAQFVPSTIGFNKTQQIIYLKDLFTDANGTNIGAHTMDIGGGWTAQNNGLCGSVSNMTIQSNQVPSGGQLLGMYTANATVASYTVSLTLVIPNAASYLIGMNVRFSDCANYWGIFIERDASGTPYMAIMDSNAGTRLYRAVVDVPGATNTTLNVRVTLSGNVITALVVGTSETCNYTSSFLNTSTLVGVLGYEGGGYTAGFFDNFLATN